MDFIQTNPWLLAGKKNLDAIVHHINDKEFVILPRDDIPKELQEAIEEVRDNFYVPGVSAKTLALQSGLSSSSTNLLAVLGKKLGFWKIWPEFNSPLWKFNAGNLPILQ